MPTRDNILVISMDEQARVAVARLSGSFTSRDIERARSGIRQQRGWTPSFAQVFDLTEVTALDLTTTDIRAAALALRRVTAAGKVIFVAQHGSIAYGLARMIQAYAAATHVHVVESVARACQLAAPPGPTIELHPSPR